MSTSTESIAPPREVETRACGVTSCTESEHDWVDGKKDDLCTTVGIGEGPFNETFWVRGFRDEATGLWEAWCEDIDLGVLEGSEGLAMVEKFALAYRAVHQHCELLNKQHVEQLILKGGGKWLSKALRSID